MIFFLFVLYICTIPTRKVYNQNIKHVLPILRAIEFLKVQKHPRPSNFTTDMPRELRCDDN